MRNDTLETTLYLVKKKFFIFVSETAPGFLVIIAKKNIKLCYWRKPYELFNFNRILKEISISQNILRKNSKQLLGNFALI